MGSEVLKLQQRVALVTGGASGIGLACARRLAEAGAHVTIGDIDETAGMAAATTLEERGLAVSFSQLDVSDEASWRNLTEHLAHKHDRLDVLVNNAGVALIKPLEHTTLSEWHRVCRINVDGTFLGMKHCLGLMRRDADAGLPSAAVINLSSAVGIVGVPGALAYSMSKAAIRHMTKSAALEFAEFGYNIRVNSVHPGLIETDMAADIYQTWADTGAFGTHDLDETKAVMRDLHPLKRHGQPADIAGGVVFLASEDAAYMTGAELVIDGGYTIR